MKTKQIVFTEENDLFEAIGFVLLENENEHIPHKLC